MRSRRSLSKHALMPDLIRSLKKPYFLLALALVLRVRLRICGLSGRASVAGHFWKGKRDRRLARSSDRSRLGSARRTNGRRERRAAGTLNERKGESEMIVRRTIAALFFDRLENVASGAPAGRRGFETPRCVYVRHGGRTLQNPPANARAYGGAVPPGKRQLRRAGDSPAFTISDSRGRSTTCPTRYQTPRVVSSGRARPARLGNDGNTLGRKSMLRSTHVTEMSRRAGRRLTPRLENVASGAPAGRRGFETPRWVSDRHGGRTLQNPLGWGPDRRISPPPFAKGEGWGPALPDAR